MQNNHHKSEEEEAFWCILADLSSRGASRIKAPVRRGGSMDPAPQSAFLGCRMTLERDRP